MVCSRHGVNKGDYEATNEQEDELTWRTLKSESLEQGSDAIRHGVETIIVMTGHVH